MFEDEAFRQFCVEHFDADRNGMITDSEVSSVDSLSVPSMEIVSLKGIEAFTSLRKLYCYDNKIEALDLSANGELTVLGCHYNDLEELSLSANTKLTSLNCNHNRISKLDLSALTELRELHVQYNELGELDLSGNPRLGILQCMENRLTELDHNEMPGPDHAVGRSDADAGDSVLDSGPGRQHVRADFRSRKYGEGRSGIRPEAARK